MAVGHAARCAVPTPTLKVLHHVVCRKFFCCGIANVWATGHGKLVWNGLVVVPGVISTGKVLPGCRQPAAAGCSPAVAGNGRFTEVTSVWNGETIRLGLPTGVVPLAARTASLRRWKPAPHLGAYFHRPLP